MKRVEFIGTSYVGKSTLYNVLSERIKSTDSYITERHYLKLARKDMGSLLFLHRKFLQKIINILGGEYEVYDIPNLNQLEDQTLDQYKHSLAICFSEEIIALKGIAFSNRTYLALLRLIAIYKFYETVVSNKTIVVEESLIHWHLVYQELVKKESLELRVISQKDLGLFPKAIIVCHADKEIILERIKLREKKGKINKNHLNKSPIEILEEVIEKQNILLHHAMVAEFLGINVLHINTANEIDQNINEIQAFLNRLK